MHEEAERIVRKVERIVRNYVEESLRGFLVGVEFFPQNGLLRVYIDTDLGITVDQCGEVARFLREQIAEDPDAEPVQRIEVASPGLDAPFRVVRQYIKNIGREVRVVTAEGTVVEGIIHYADDEKVVLRVHQKKGKQVVEEEMEIPYLRIKETRLLLRF